jgi:hypothetical protein
MKLGRRHGRGRERFKLSRSIMVALDFVTPPTIHYD